MKIAVVGNPNVGKSSVLNTITGSQLFASNYVGTSLEIEKAQLSLESRSIEFFDSPGIYSLYSDTKESEITRNLLSHRDIDLMIQIVDATNLERNLVLSYELLDLDIPLLLIINQVDRLNEKGIQINAQELSSLLKCYVIPFSAATGEGKETFLSLMKNEAFSSLSKDEGGPKGKQIILEDGWICKGNCKACSLRVEPCLTDADYERAQKAKQTSGRVISIITAEPKPWLNKVEKFVDQPILGTILLLGIAYLGFIILLQFIGLSEGPLNALLEPVSLWIEQTLLAILPSGMIAVVLSKAVPEGLIIPFTIIMPAMIMVSLLMAMVEDTGLLPRYSVALERVGRFFGVSGQAIIPLSLGFGCRTPAVIATRLLPNDSQRFIITTILSIVIPCAATIGIMAMVIAEFHASLLVMVVSMLVVMVVLGLLLSRMMPQEEVFIYELPPLRVPQAKNVWNKVKIRFSGFFSEVLPLLLLMSIVIRALMESGLLEVFASLEHITRLLFGIPAEAFVAVLITIFQRYLAPLVLLNLPLTPREATIAITMIGLSLPCLPVMVMTVRELGMKSLLKILGMGFATSFTVGIILNIILPM